MKSLLQITIFFLGSFFLFGQNKKTCENELNKIEDINVINFNKCLYDKSSKKNQKVFKQRMQQQLSLNISSKKKNTYLLAKQKLIKSRNKLKKNLTFAKEIKNTNFESVPNEILFALVDELPKFFTCANNTVDCFNFEFRNHFFEYFEYPSKAIKNEVKGRVFVRFVISKEGLISNIKTHSYGNKKILEDEVKRVLRKFPKLKPGIESGKAIDVVYSIPITFDLEYADKEKLLSEK